MTVDQDRVLLGDCLKRVSRSFYLTLTVLPHSVRRQIGVAYLFARAADTIADTDLIERSRRLALLRCLKRQFAEDAVDWATVRDIQAAVLPHQGSAGERSLCERLDDCFRLYRRLQDEDRVRIAALMTTLTNGMEMDLTVFPGDSVKDVTALKSMDELDQYIYYVAGCVGEFWTRMICAHVPAVRHWDVARMSEFGVQFGKGLQLTNVLKDIARDLHRGRCYLPQAQLDDVGLKPVELLDPATLPRVKPVLRRLTAQAREYLDDGWRYTMAIPRQAIRLRLACMWPILFAGATLRDVARSPDLLDPRVNVKIGKSEVYRIMAITTGTLGCGYVGTAYWGRLRKWLD